MAFIKCKELWEWECVHDSPNYVKPSEFAITLMTESIHFPNFYYQSHLIRPFALTLPNIPLETRELCILCNIASCCTIKMLKLTITASGCTDKTFYQLSDILTTDTNDWYDVGIINYMSYAGRYNLLLLSQHWYITSNCSISYPHSYGNLITM